MHVVDHQLLLFPPLRPLADRFGADFFRSVPEQPGVYLMSAARDGVLYVGKAKNLRRRLGSYHSASRGCLTRKLTRLLLRVERIDWDECADEAAAMARERELIRALQPRFNTMGLRAPKQWFIGWQRRGDSLRLALDEKPDGWPEVRGPFVFARPVFAALLRSCWLELHSGASVAELPSRLSTWSPPTRWDVTWNGSVEKWLAGMDAFLRGRESKLLPCFPVAPTHLSVAADVSRLTFPPDVAGDQSGLTSAATEARVPSPVTFDEQWRAMDAAECLADFHDRMAATHLLLS